LDGCARKTAGGWSLERSGGVAAVCWGCVGGSEWSLGYVWENGEWIMNIWQIKERKNNRKEKRKKNQGYCGHLINLPQYVMHHENCFSKCFFKNDFNLVTKSTPPLQPRPC
jgi:hypothetical protein